MKAARLVSLVAMLVAGTALACSGPGETERRPDAESTPIFLASTAVAERLTGVTAVGDSVMLAAADRLEEAGVEVDAEVGRSVPGALEVLRGIAERGELGETVFVHIGHNSVFTPEEFDEFVRLADGRPIVFLTVNVPLSWEGPNNAVMREGAARHPNVTVVEWKEAVADRPDLFWDDGIHLRPEGAAFYADFVSELLR